MTRIAVFLLVSVGLLWLSRKSLLTPRVHGFYRFFAVELALVVVLLNAPGWFHDPWSPRQVVSWVLLFGSAVLPVLGFRLLRSVGAPLGGIEQTTRLVTEGIYRYIRHPLYCSFLLAIWGAFLKRPACVPAAVGALGSFFVVATAKVEERECMEKFGAPYETYRATTKMFIPFVV